MRHHYWIGVLIFALVLVPAGMMFMASLRSPTLYPGDRIETRTCRYCNGTGRSDSEEANVVGNKCPVCGGTGKVQVIYPGNEHPTVVQGRVVLNSDDNQQWRHGNDDPDAQRNDADPFSHYPGLTSQIPGAQLIFTSAGKTTELTTNDYGDFRAELAPGTYTITAEADGYQKTVGECDIQPLTEPIWIELAHISDNTPSFAEAQSNYGLTTIVGLSKSNSGDGWVNVFQGAP